MSSLSSSALADLQARLQAYVLGDGSDLDDVLPLVTDRAAHASDSAASCGGRDKGRRRLSIYHSAYRSRLREVLGLAFERTWSYLGDEEFDAMCARHIEAHSSHSDNLRDYGGDFPRFLRQALPADPEVAELATMDWLLHAAFDAPNAEMLSSAQLAQVEEAQWASLRFVFHPSVSLALFEWNVLDMWHALDKGESPPVAQRLGVPLGHLFWRSGQRCHFRTLGAEEHAALAGLLEGSSFARVCEELDRSFPTAAIETVIGTWLARWLADELLSAVAFDPV